MNSAEEIWITSTGIISAIGNNSEDCFSKLRSSHSGIRPIQNIPTKYQQEFVAGEIDLSNEEIAKICGVDPHLPRTTLLALYAALEAIESADLKENMLQHAGLILGTTVGGMDKSEKLYLSKESPEQYLDSHPCGFSTRFVAKTFNICGYSNTISTACSSGANAILLGARMIKHGFLDIVIAGGSDALSLFTFNGFRTLMILDPEPCRPFSADRKGLNLGEGAAFVVLESKSHAENRNRKGICKVSGYANCNDAFHQTASSPDGRGPYRAMKEAIDSAGISPHEIDYINVHGTGTDNNDLTESIALTNLFGDKIPRFSSTKAYTGHCLGAAGAMEAVFSAFAIQNNTVFPNLRFTSSIAETNLIPETQVTSTAVSHVLSNSFGFGGCDTSLVLSKIN
jgi:3-oxoacyl-[acyl-carrier-protein] synthase-1